MTSDDKELDLLRAALQAKAPGPDESAKARALRMAMESFDHHQGMQAELRSKQDRPKGAGLLGGVLNMFDRLTSRAALGATASIAVIGIGAFLVVQPDMAPMQGVGPAQDAAAPQGRDASPEIAIPEIARPEIAAPTAGGQVATEPAQVVSPMAADEHSAAPPAPIQPAPMERMATSEREIAPAQGNAGKMTADTARSVVAPPSPTRVSPMAPELSHQMAAPSSTDTMAQFDPNPLKITGEEPVSTFSIDVDTAYWSWLRGGLRMGQLPDPASVRIEEMVNYFPYSYPAPAEDQPFSTNVAVYETPWNAGTQLVRIGLQGELPLSDARPPLNLVFLVDTSGSMQGADRLGLLKTAFTMLLGELRPEDKIAIVSYAGFAGQVLEATPASDKAKIMAALDALQSGGGTAGAAGLQMAYDVASSMATEGSVNRVVLATDGDFNVGLSDEDALKAFVTNRRKTGTYLSILGFGRGNLDDSLMQVLAQNGNGQAAYIDTAEEARKVLVDQAAGALFPIAGDVKIQVEWNPAQVAEYRLLGYETRALNREDFANDKVDAGEIGAGHQVTALYEITPVGSDARLTEPLRYGTQPPSDLAQEAGWLRLRYKAPGSETSQLIETAIPMTPTTADEDARFATAIAGFGQLLSGGKYLGDWGYDQAVALAEGAKGADPYGYRAEAISLLRTAQALSAK